MEKTIDVNGISLHYRVLGNGSPVMLVHGFGEDSRVWDLVEGPLSERFRLILPDLPGSGKSEGMEGSPTIEDFADVLSAVAKAEGINVFTMIGHSMGGYITLAFAEKFPERLDGYGLFHSTADPDTPEKKEMRRKGMAFMAEHGAERFLRQSTPNLFAERFRLTHPEEVEEMLARGNGFTAKTLQQYYQAMIQRPDRKGVLKNAKVPVLFIMGDEDKAVNLSDVLSQSHLPPIAHVLVWKGVAHMGMRESPKLSLEALVKYLLHAKGQTIEPDLFTHPRD